MQAEFWHQRWQEGKIGFHRHEINPVLIRHWSSLGVAQNGRILVPLCGKTQDMCWLARQGYEVHGVELSRIAVEAFFSENGLSPEISEEGMLRHWWHDDLHVWEGDFFAIDRDHGGLFDAVYDRAALVALPETMRQDYVTHMRVLAPTAPVLLVTLEYDQSRMDGPPFSVDADEVLRRFGDSHEISLLEDIDLMAGEEGERFRQRGLTTMREKIWRLLPR